MAAYFDMPSSSLFINYHIIRRYEVWATDKVYKEATKYRDSFRNKLLTKQIAAVFLVRFQYISLH
jgi:hypothetical protein